MKHTSIYLTPKNHYGFANSCSYDGAILSMIVHDLILAVFDVVSTGLVPCRWNETQCLKLVSYFISVEDLI